MTKTWPSYSTASHDHLVALGVITTNWNTLERVLFQLFFCFLEAPRDSAKTTFHALGNVGRSEVLLTLARRGEYRLDVVEHVQHFVKAFDICRENRNWLLHAHATSETSDSVLVMEKQSRKDAFSSRTLMFPVEQLRSVADEIHATLEFGGKIYIHLESSRPEIMELAPEGHHPRPLPEKISLPRKLDQAVAGRPEREAS
jgi:hypothetical protein